MPVIETDNLPHAMTPEETHWVYNGLDCTITYEVWDEIKPLLDENAELIYRFEMAQREVALEIMNNGILIDVVTRKELKDAFNAQLDRVQTTLNLFSNALMDKPLNAKSNKQVAELLYDRMGLPEQTKFSAARQKRVRTVDIPALEKLKAYLIARPLINCILAVREVRDKISDLNCSLEPNGRMRSSMNVGATENGRWSSSENVFSRGTNSQNITSEHRKSHAHLAIRRMYVASDGYKLGYPDLEQAESRVVAYLANDNNYIEAHKTGDPHTLVAQLVFGLEPSGDLAKDKAAASQPYYRQFSYRDMAKRAGHATNYYAQPHTIAGHLKIPVEVAQEFQRLYFRQFPGIRNWHNSTIVDLQRQGFLISPLGRRRHFFGRLDDNATIREAIASVPQSVVGDILNIGAIKVQRLNLPIKLINQIHDAILFEFPDGQDETIIPQIIKAMEVPFMCNGHVVTIPVECETGWDWHNVSNWRKNVGVDRPVPPRTSLLEANASNAR